MGQVSRIRHNNSCKKKVKLRPIAVVTAFILIIVFVLNKILFSNFLIGRSIDFPVPPVDSLIINLIRSNLYQWWSSVNGGTRNTFMPALLPINSILYFPLIFGAGSWFISRYQMVLTLFIGAYSFFLLSNHLINRNHKSASIGIIVSFVGSIFFVFNNYYFCELIFGSNVMYLTFSFVPLLVLYVLKYLEVKNLNNMLISLLLLVIVSSTLQHLVLSYILVVGLSIIKKEYKFPFILFALHILVSSYWIIPMLHSSKQILGNEVAQNFGGQSLSGYSSVLRTLVNQDYVFNRNLYLLAINNDQYKLIWQLAAYVALIICSLPLLFGQSKDSKTTKYLYFFYLIFLLSIFFAKGSRYPFGSMITFLYNKIAFFSLFRSLQHYLSFYVFSISIVFVISLSSLTQRSRWYLPIISVLVFILAMPWWLTMDLGTNNISKSKIPTTVGLFRLSKGEKIMYELNNEPGDFRILHIPPGNSVNYLDNEGRVRNQGGDAGLTFGSKGSFASESSGNLKKVLSILEKEIYTSDNVIDKNINLFRTLNIKYIVLRRNISPLYSDNYMYFNWKNIDKNISSSKSIDLVYKESDIEIYKILDKLFLPHIYIANSTSSAYATPSKPFNVTQKNLYTTNKHSLFTNNNLRKLEFKQVNPVKYKLKLLSVQGYVPIVFSETYNSGWQIFTSNYSKSNNLILNNIGRAEMNSSPKNNGLTNGKVSDTWFQAPIVLENNHLLVNNYANGWVLDITRVCEIRPDSCEINSDGSVNVILIIEFWPQRLFYLGLIISGTTLLGLTGYSVYIWYKERKVNRKKNDKAENL